jgi:hypothetical protein
VSDLAPLPNAHKDIDSSKAIPARRRNFEVIELRKPEKIRVELNIEKWPAIWQPSRSKNKSQLRVFERQVTLEGGSKINARLEVSFNHLGTLTTEERRMYAALIKQWEDAGKPTTPVFFSDRQLARILKKGWGTNVLESTTKSLRKLRTISLEWINAYYDAAGKMTRTRQPMTFLAELKIVERGEDGTVNSAKGYFRFDDALLSSLLINHTKPYFIDELVDIKTDIGLLLHCHADLVMADKRRYERCTKDLFEDLGLRNPEYRSMHKRKRALEAPMKEMVGRRLSTGVIASAVIEKTQDHKDYKIVLVKTSAARAIVAAELQSKKDEALEESAQAKNQKQNKFIEQQAEELVCYFHETFHNVKNYQPRLKEVGQAVSLIASLGFDKARYVIDFSRREAEKTKYQPQTFGGILQYTGRAVSAYDGALHAKEHAQQQKAKQDEAARLETEFDAYIRSAIDHFITDPERQAEVAEIHELERALLRGQFSEFPDGTLKTLVQHAVRKGICQISFFSWRRALGPGQGNRLKA